ncbi:ribonuclease H1-like [Phlebotomus argentipes]|uniref:ribonuclease H1-like n=1 Tax=Phlebotomus argentipes TaxID=94469 RepID=UPI0028936C09|nr:ribonuclease H1-like [Phlebotomus argentipes]
MSILLRRLKLILGMPFYAVARGRQPGIYSTWDECKKNVDGFSGARYKKFSSETECLTFIEQNKSGPVLASTSATSSLAPSAPRENRKAWKGKRLADLCPNLLMSRGVKRARTSEEAEKSDDFLDVWTDGACPGNGFNATAAGRGVFFGDDHPWNVAERADGPPTNNRGEIQASRRAIEIAKSQGIKKLRINTDSDFLIKSVENYMPRWKKNGWKTADRRDVKNKDDFILLDKVLDGTIEIQWKHVPGHKGVYGNEKADELARLGASK